MSVSLNVNDTTVCLNETLCFTRTYFDMKAFQPIYMIVLVVNTVLAITVTSFASFIIWKRSTMQMKAYKWSILNIIWTGLSFEILLCVWMPVPLFPIYGGYNGGILSSASLTVIQGVQKKWNFLDFFINLGPEN